MSNVQDAPENSLPPLLLDPPWTWEPVVREDLEAPQAPVSVSWNSYLRERLQEEASSRGRKDADWEAVAERFRSGRALTELTGKGRGPLYAGLLLHGPEELAHELLEDRRYWDEFTDLQVLGGVVVRHELKAYPLALHIAAREDPDSARPLKAFLSADAAKVMVAKDAGGDSVGREWVRTHGAAAAPLLVPYALGRPGPLRTGAESLLRTIIADFGDDAVLQAAPPYGAEAVRAMEMLRYPASMPKTGGNRAPEELPQVLLRGRDAALPASATRNLTALLLLSKPGRPHSFVEQVIEVCDPGSLAEFAWALYLTVDLTKYSARYSWAPDGIQYALGRLGDGETARRLAEVIAGWESWWAGPRAARNALNVFVAIGSDTALRTLHRIADNPHPSKNVREEAQYALERAARTRGTTAARLLDRLVPDFGLDAEGAMTLDYGARRFRVGFDEQLRPYVIDDAGKHRKSLPKPGPKDDAEIAVPAHQRFTELKKGVRAIATEQRKRLHEAMLTGRDWPLEEFRALYVDHPLLRHFARRLVWIAEHDGTATAFRIAEDRSLADIDDKEFVLSPAARIALAHPVRLDAALGAWGQVFADYEIVQPFPQLGRPVHRLSEEEQAASRLTRFEGAEVPTAAVTRLAQGDWSLKTGRGASYNRTVLQTPVVEGRYTEVRFGPGIARKISDSAPTQKIDQVEHLKFGPKGLVGEPFGSLDPLAASELLADLTDLTNGN
ncbi:hypothetical protein GCM10010191_80360 [Actinomadura vinacea]|uniref:DUF4132 domain-containing protein n=1 Tax=Actinomadura vinacea TaxID=115336 RepID=A0ABN3K9F2_9ACTN